MIPLTKFDLKKTIIDLMGAGGDKYLSKVLLG